MPINPDDPWGALLDAAKTDDDPWGALIDSATQAHAHLASVAGTVNRVAPSPRYNAFGQTVADSTLRGKAPTYAQPTGQPDRYAINKRLLWMDAESVMPRGAGTESWGASPNDPNPIVARSGLLQDVARNPRNYIKPTITPVVTEASPDGPSGFWRNFSQSLAQIGQNLPGPVNDWSEEVLSQPAGTGVGGKLGTAAGVGAQIGASVLAPEAAIPVFVYDSAATTFRNTGDPVAAVGTAAVESAANLLGLKAATKVGSRIAWAGRGTEGWAWNAASKQFQHELGQAVMSGNEAAVRAVLGKIFGGAANGMTRGTIDMVGRHAVMVSTGNEELRDALSAMAEEAPTVLGAGALGGAGVGAVQATSAYMSVRSRVRAAQKEAASFGEYGRRVRSTSRPSSPEDAVFDRAGQRGGGEEGDMAPGPVGGSNPKGPKTPGRNGLVSPEVRGTAENYLATNGQRLGLSAQNINDDTAPTMDTSYSTRVADAYEAMPHNPDDPMVIEAYNQFKGEIKDQYAHAVGQGWVMAPFESTPDQPQPYKNSREASERIPVERTVYFFTGGDMPPDHPLAEVDPDTGLTYNDMFRAVHDFYGHVANGNEFGPLGETAAARDHSQMFSPLARLAMLSETVGQNSWVNFGPHLRNESGAVPKRGEPGYIPPPERPFAQQKAGILPRELISQFVAKPGQKFRTLYHISTEPRSEIDPSFQGSGAAGTERRFGGGPKVSYLYSTHPESPLVASDAETVMAQMNRGKAYGKSGRAVHRVEGLFNTLDTDTIEGQALLDKWTAEHSALQKKANRAEGGFDLLPLPEYLKQRAVEAGYDSTEGQGVMAVFRKIGKHEIVSANEKIDTGAGVSTLRKNPAAIRGFHALYAWRRGEESVARAKDAFESGEPFAVITANNPAYQTKVAKAGERGNDALVRRAYELGYQGTPIAGTGFWEGNDEGESIVFPGMSEQMASQLTDEFGQKAFINQRGIIYPRENAIEQRNPALDVYGPEAKDEDGYTRFVGKDGEYTVSLGINTQNKVDMDELELMAEEADAPTVLPGHGIPGARPGGIINPIEAISSAGSAAKAVAMAVKAGLTGNIARNLTPAELSSMSKRLATSIVKIYSEFPPDSHYEAAVLAGIAKRGWYKRAAVTLRAMFGPEAPRFIGVLAAQSPRQPVVQNLRMTLRTWRAWNDAGRPTDPAAIKAILKKIPGAGMGSRSKNTVIALTSSLEDITKFAGIEFDEPLGGRKVSAFFQNLQGNLQSVTADTWMAYMAAVPQKLFGKKAGYLAHSAKIRNIAKQMGLEPAEVQETVWTTIKVLGEMTGRGAGPKAAVEAISSKVNKSPEFATLMLDDKEIRNELERIGVADAIRSYLSEQRRERAAAVAEAGAKGKAPDTRVLERVAGRLNVETSAPREGDYGEGTAILHGGDGGLFSAQIEALEQRGMEQIRKAKSEIERAIIASRSTLGANYIPGALIKANLSFAMGVARVAAARGLRKVSEIKALVEKMAKDQPKSVSSNADDIVKVAHGIVSTSVRGGNIDAGAVEKKIKELDKRGKRYEFVEKKKAEREAAKIEAAKKEREVKNPSAIKVPGVPGKTTQPLRYTEGEALKGAMKKASSAASAGFAAGEAVGKESGKAAGREAGLREGFSAGKEQGKAEGLEQGLRAGESTRKVGPDTVREKRIYTERQALRGALRREVAAAKKAHAAAKAESRAKAKARIDDMMRKYREGSLVSGFNVEKARRLVKALLPNVLHAQYVKSLALASGDRDVYRILQRAQRDYTVMVGRRLGRQLSRLTTNKSLAVLSKQDQATARKELAGAQESMEMLKSPAKLTASQVRDAVQLIDQALNEVALILHREKEAKKVRIGAQVVATNEAIGQIKASLSTKPTIPFDHTRQKGPQRASAATRFINMNADMRTVAMKMDNDLSGAGAAHKLVDAVAEANKRYLGQVREDHDLLDQGVRIAGYKNMGEARVKASGMLGQTLQESSSHEVSTLDGGTARRKFTLAEKYAVAAMDDDTLMQIHRGEHAVDEARAEMEAIKDEFDNSDDYEDALDKALEDAEGSKSTPLSFKAEGEGSVPFILTVAQREAIVGSLSRGERRMIKWIKAAIMAGERRDEFIEAIRLLKGVAPEVVDKYFPRQRRSSLMVKPNQPKGWREVSQAMLENTGYGKQRGADVRDPILVSDFFDVIDRYINERAKVVHLAEPIRSASLVLQDQNLKQALVSRMGASEADHIDDWVEAATHAIPAPSTNFDKFWRWIAQRTQRAMIGLNPGSLGKNLTSGTVRLSAVLLPKDVAAALSEVKSKATRTRLLDMLYRSPYLHHRVHGDPTRLFSGFEDQRGAIDRPTFMAATKATAINLLALAKGVTTPRLMASRLSDADKSLLQVVRSLRAYAWVEQEIIMVALGAALKQAARELPGGAPADVEARAIKVAEDAIARTQASWDPDRMTRAQHVQARSPFAYTILPYLSDPGRVANLVFQAGRKGLLRVLLTIAASAVVSALVGSALSPDSAYLAGAAVGGGSDAGREKAAAGAVKNAAKNALSETIGNVAGVGALLDSAFAAHGFLTGNPLTDNPTFDFFGRALSSARDIVLGIFEILDGAEPGSDQEIVAADRLISGIWKGIKTLGGTGTGTGPAGARLGKFFQGLADSD